jgi:hypothetical protein
MKWRPMNVQLPIFYVLSLVLLSVAYGMWAWEKKWFPAPWVTESIAAWKILTEDEDKKLLNAQPSVEPEAAHAVVVNAERMQPGLTLLTAQDRILKAAVVDARGTAVQEWAIDWQTLWPNATHLPAKKIPKTRPGTQIHGAVLMANGDLVFNFDFLGMMRLNPCNEVVWRLPYRTHHSIHVDADGNLWASGQRNHAKESSDFPSYKPPFIEPTILKISPDGKVLLEKSVMQLLIDNNLEGLLYLQGKTDFAVETTGDTLHLNDVETFDLDTSGAFTKGDIMISLRNVNTVLIFDRDWKLKYRWSSDFVRQHDPDFIDANRISVFDNHFIVNQAGEHASRILIRDFAADTQTTYFEGRLEHSFYSFIMGKHQWLENGNLLISETTNARAFEIDPGGEVVWEYYHRNEKGMPALLEEAQRLPAQFTPEFFEERRRACQAN